jgi:hypothetical protein
MLTPQARDTTNHVAPRPNATLKVRNPESKYHIFVRRLWFIIVAFVVRSPVVEQYIFSREEILG